MKTIKPRHIKMKLFTLAFSMILLAQCSHGQCLWQGVLKADDDNQIYGAAPYKGGLAVIIRGDFSIFGTIDPPISYIGIVQGDSLDTLTAAFGPQSATNQQLLRHIVSFNDTLMIHGYYNEINGSATITSTHFYTDSGIISPVPLGMIPWQDGLFQDRNSEVIFMFPYVNDYDSILGTIISIIQLYQNGNFKLYDTVLYTSVLDALPLLESPVMLDGEVIALNTNHDYGNGYGIYYLNRDSAKWLLDMPLNRTKTSLLTWNEEVYLTNSNNKIWKKDANGWQVFYETADSNQCVRDLYVFKDELYVMEGENDGFKNCNITDVSVFRDGDFKSTANNGIELLDDYAYRQGSFTDDGQYLYIYGKVIRIKSCDIGRYSLYRLVIPLSVDEPNIRDRTIEVYPNPANTILNITKTNQKVESLVFFNFAGVQIKAVQIKGSTEVDVSSWPAGVYFYRAGNEVDKVVIAR